MRLRGVAAGLVLVAACLACAPAGDAGGEIRTGDAGNAGKDTGRVPNVVVILADDLGIGDPGCFHAASRIPMPSLDRIAAEGMRLSDMHSPSAVCTPTRYGLLTGRYAWRGTLKSGVLDGHSPHLIEAGRPTLASMLRERGYRTGAFGKWHLGLGEGRTDYAAPLAPGPLEDGFERFFGVAASLDMPPYAFVVDHGLERPASETTPGSAHRRQGGGGFWRAGAIAPGFSFEGTLPRIVDEALAWMDAVAPRAPGDAPFFLYLPLPAPHTPWVPTEEFQGATEVGWYGDYVAEVDFEIGRVADALDRLGLAGDTLLVVTSDNGAHWPIADVERWGHDANGGYRGQKADIWEGGHRVPFVARWPERIPAGVVRADLACLVDLCATIAAATGDAWSGAGAEDSFDLLPVLLDADLEEPVRDHVVHHSFDGHFALRAGRWKLIPQLGSGGFTAPRTAEPGPGEPAGQLYDLVEDPRETTNLWSARPDVVAELTARLAELRAAAGSR